MTYPPQQQPGNWQDPSWPPPQYPDPTSGAPNYGGYGTPTSGAPGYGAPASPAYGYGAPMVPVAPKTNGMAIAALVCALAGLVTCVSAPVGAILGHVARRQIRERGEGGDGMALTGIIVGWILTGLGLAYLIFVVVFVIIGINSGSSTTL
jgi:Domain of unknown function (DUF4190)